MTKSNLSSASQISSSAFSRNGYEFDPTTRRWELSRDVTVRLRWVDELCNDQLQRGAVKTLVHYAQTYAAGSTSAVAQELRVFLLSIVPTGKKLSLISPYMLINYRATLDSATEHHLGVLRSFLKKWVNLGYGGVDPEVVKLLYGWTIKGGVKGLAVKTKCPIKGALSDFEYEGLQQRLVDAFDQNDIALDDFVLVLLFAATGRRPCQLGDIKILDFIVAQASDGLQEFVLNVPRRKQRGTVWREEFKPVALTPEIGLAVQRLIRNNELRILRLRPDLDAATRRGLPLFPAWRNLVRMADEDSTSISALMKTDAFHVKTEVLSRRLEQVVGSLSVPSERTGAPIRVFPYRLRRTIGTRAAREGYGSLVIAELLDHTDTQNVMVYTENVPEHIDAINKALAHQLAPLAQAFAGVLVDSESDALRGRDMTSRIRTDGGSCTGSCGHYGFCGASAPIACYTCRHFQPWLDGPHEEVLEALRSEHFRILEITRDPEIASINDRTIFAVTEVIQRCESRRAELREARRLG